jgi:uncharacterized protein
MELTNDFTVAAPIDEAWPLLTDIERIAPCVPGFKLTGSANGEYRGAMKIKVGAVQTTYDCVIRFVELDDESHRAVIAAEGKETRGQGGVTASITSTLTAEGESTRASVVTNLNVTGRVAQFGRGILAEVSDRLVKQFVKRLESMVLSQGAPGAGPVSPAAGGNGSGGVPGAGTPASQPAATPASSSDDDDDDDDDDALNLLSVAGGPVVKRLVPLLLAALIALIVIRTVARGG